MEVEDENRDIKETIELNNEKIKNYREYIKLLEEINAGYKAVMAANSVKVKEVEDDDVRLTFFLELILRLCQRCFISGILCV